MTKMTYMLYFLVLLQFANCLSSPGNNQHYTPPSPTDDFFNFDDDPFAKHLEETYTAKSHSPSLSRDISRSDSSDQRGDTGARLTNRPYQYVPRKVRFYAIVCHLTRIIHLSAFSCVAISGFRKKFISKEVKEI